MHLENYVSIRTYYKANHISGDIYKCRTLFLKVGRGIDRMQWWQWWSGHWTNWRTTTCPEIIFLGGWLSWQTGSTVPSQSCFRTLPPHLLHLKIKLALTSLWVINGLALHALIIPFILTLTQPGCVQVYIAPADHLLFYLCQMKRKISSL